jgi:hypothetical protein
MTVYQNRVAAAYRRKMDLPHMLMVTMVLILLAGAFVYAGNADFEEQNKPLFARNN